MYNISSMLLMFRAATAGKAPKAWALPRLWVSIRSYKKQPEKKFGVEYRTLPVSNMCLELTFLA